MNPQLFSLRHKLGPSQLIVFDDMIVGSVTSHLFFVGTDGRTYEISDLIPEYKFPKGTCAIAFLSGFRPEIAKQIEFYQP